MEVVLDRVALKGDCKTYCDIVVRPMGNGSSIRNIMRILSHVNGSTLGDPLRPPT